MKSYTCRVRVNLDSEYFNILEYRFPRITKYEIYQMSDNIFKLGVNPEIFIASNPKEALQRCLRKEGFREGSYRIDILSVNERKNYYTERLENYLLQEYVDKSFFLDVWGLDDSSIEFFDNVKFKQNVNGEEKYSRWKIEEFLKERRLIPSRLAAIKLGVKNLYMQNVLDFLAKDFLHDCCLSFSKKIVRMDSLRRIPQVVFKYESFEKREDFLNKFLWLLKDNNIECNPDYCFIELNLTKRKVFVDQLDMVINRPVSIQYCIPVQNRKPSYMQPDIISSYSNWICSGDSNLKLMNMINQTAIKTTKKMG